jgi:LemA protein
MDVGEGGAGVSVIPSLVLLFVAAGLLIYLGMLYNGLVALRNDIDKAWANIDVLLKQRHDELPRLLDVCKGYMHYEQKTLERLIEARTQYASAMTVNQKTQASSNVSASVHHLFATAENYPDLKANASFLELQRRITELENQIADRREFYNDAINLFNTRIKQMPDVLVAGATGMKPRVMFLATAVERVAVPVAVNAPTR